MIKRSDILTIFGLLSLFIGLIAPYEDTNISYGFFASAIIFFTGAIITKEIEAKKCH